MFQSISQLTFIISVITSERFQEELPLVFGPELIRKNQSLYALNGKTNQVNKNLSSSIFKGLCLDTLSMS